MKELEKQKDKYFSFFNDDCIEEIEIEVEIASSQEKIIYKDQLIPTVEGEKKGPHKRKSKTRRLKIDNLNWFTLKNYELIKEIKRDKLFDIIEKRRRVADDIYFYNENLNTDDYNNNKEYYESIKQVASDNFITSCLDYDFDHVGNFFVFGHYIGIVKDRIYPVQYTDAHNEVFDLKDLPDNEINNYFNLFYKALVKVDLNVSDDLLIDEFKQWLADKRTEEEINQSKRLSDNDFKKIANYNIIPYIDLILWRDITGNKLTNKQIANLLFPDDPNIQEETIRKRVKELAEKLLYSDVNLI